MPMPMPMHMHMHDLIFMMFDLYTGVGDDLTALEFNQYAKLVKDYHLSDPKSKAAKSSDLDRAFIAVDTASKRYNGDVDKGLQDRHEREKALSLA